MPGPWERFQPQQPSPTPDAAPTAAPTSAAGPWTKFAAPAAPPASAPPANSGGVAGYASQGLSGVNQGIANTLGAPVDLVNLIMGGADNAINAVAGTDFHPAEKPFLGSASIGDMMRGAGAITPDSSDPGQQFVRRVGEEVGGAVVPEMGLAGRAGQGIGAVVRGLGPAAAAGAGAAAAQQVAPGNQAAEIAGEMIGGVVPSSALSMGRRAAAQVAAPTLDELQAAKNAAYAKVDTLGAHFNSNAVDRFVNEATQQAAADNISSRRHPRSWSILEELNARPPGSTMSLTQLDQLRQTVYRDLVKPAVGNPEHEAEAYFGKQIIDNIDNLIQNAGPADMLNGSGPEAAAAIQAARAANAQYRKVQLLDNTVEHAQHQTAATGSGGNINNKLRQAMTGIADNPRRAQGFTPAEIDEMHRIIMGTPLDSVARTVGKLAPGGNGLMTALNTGAVVSNPVMAAIPILATVAKRAADNATIGRVNRLRADIARGGAATLPPFYSPAQQDALGAAAASSVSNQRNQKRESDDLKAAIMRGLN